MKVHEITEAIIGAAIEVHRTIGPGLLESAYIQCLGYELALGKIPFQLELPLPVPYNGLKLDCGYRLDLVVADAVVVEVKAVDRVTPLHEAQLLTYLRLGGWKAGLLINFNTPLLRDGMVRRVLAFDESKQRADHARLADALQRPHARRSEAEPH
jgi:GxxExxY protein